MTTYTDSQTGGEVARLTDLGEHCHHPYFYNRCFTADSLRSLRGRTREKAVPMRLKVGFD